MGPNIFVAESLFFGILMGLILALILTLVSELKKYFFLAFGIVWIAILSGFLWSCQPNYQTNRLNSQKSPYLLQHSENPIWWQPWTKDTLDYAKKNKINYIVVEPNKRSIVKKSYADNFLK